MPAAYLVLEDGTVFRGEPFGASQEAYGEVVFNTSMTGYQEMLTDPSYGGQILVLTYPLVGNYGINPDDFESRRVQVRALVVREAARHPSHWQSTATLHEYLAGTGIPGIAGVDTRALTRHLRSLGVMMGLLTHGGSPEEALSRLRAMPGYGTLDYVRLVSTPEAYDWNDAPGPRIALVDYGVKTNILRSLGRFGAAIRVYPCAAPASAILADRPDGILLSPGPGDPATLDYAMETVQALVGTGIPLFGICLGHQLVGRAFGASTFKLPFGHRGGNHPVRDEATGTVSITSQNHGYAIDASGLPPGVEVSHVNLNDHTVEGLRHRDVPVMTIQYHSEAAPGPLDNMVLFERFLDLCRGTR